MGGYVLDVIRKPRTPKLFLECYCIASKSQSGVSLLRGGLIRCEKIANIDFPFVVVEILYEF